MFFWVGFCCDVLVTQATKVARITRSDAALAYCLYAKPDNAYGAQLTAIAAIATDKAASQPEGQPSVLTYFSSSFSSFCGDFTLMIVTPCFSITSNSDCGFTTFCCETSVTVGFWFASMIVIPLLIWLFQQIFRTLCSSNHTSDLMFRYSKFNNNRKVLLCASQHIGLHHI